MAADGPRLVETATGARTWSDAERCAGRRVGLVPTMGALHAGHVSLVRSARRECERTVVSIFVNPLQFAPGEDFERYPRRLEDDLDVLRREGVDAAFVPSVEAMYPPDATTRVRVAALDDVLEGACRPGHFEGVATVVLKLFDAVRPDRAYFGQKDAQQAAVVTRLAGDLDTGVEVVVCPTVREPDGLALSSRNVFPARRRAARGPVPVPGADRRQRAPPGGRARRGRAASGAARDARCRAAGPSGLRGGGGRAHLSRPGSLAVLAVRIGATRLIDNHRLGEPLRAE